MDKQSLTGTILILIVTLVYLYFQQQNFEEEQRLKAAQDSLATVQMVEDSLMAASQPAPAPEVQQPAQLAPAVPDSLINRPLMGSEDEKVFHLETDLIKAAISTRNGAKLVHWELKKYDHFRDGEKDGFVDLANSPTGFNVPNNGLNLRFEGPDGKTIDLNNFNLYTDQASTSTQFLDENNSQKTIEFYLPVGQGRVVKSFTFHNGSYAVDVAVRFENISAVTSNRFYTLGWENGLPSTEENLRDDMDYARAYAFMGGERLDLDASADERSEEEKNGNLDWVAIRTKYFLMAMIPNQTIDSRVTLTGQGMESEEGVYKVFNASLMMDLPVGTNQHTDSLKLFLGPMDHHILGKYDVGLENLVMSKDWYEGLFRWISLLILPILEMLYKIIPNYGFVIIIFSILIKLVLYPLTKKSHEGMSRMQTMQPKMQALKEKYGEDMQRYNQEVMKLYKEEKFNPASGCLPTLLQMPLLFALFIVFRSTIQLRGEPFVAWITDLSRPDALHLGFDLPYIGSTLAVLPLLMALTMFWQSKVTITDPKQKTMAYVMPVFLLFVFYRLPSGLNLYYSVFNILTMIQTRMIKSKMDNNEGITPEGGRPGPAAKVVAKKKKEEPRRPSAMGGNRQQRRQQKKK